MQSSISQGAHEMILGQIMVEGQASGDRSSKSFIQLRSVPCQGQRRCEILDLPLRGSFGEAYAAAEKTAVALPADTSERY